MRSSNPATAARSSCETFVYDSLGRQLTADNPEDSGDIDYEYDDNGNMTKKTDARGVVTNFLYDVLNRLTEKNYSDGTPRARYCYDGQICDMTTEACAAASPAISYAVGRLTGHGVDGWTATKFTGFDPVGRVTASTQTTSTTSQGTPVNYTFAYAYNRDGSLASITYPSGKTIAYTYNQAGEPLTAAQASGPSYVSSVAYSAQGAVSQLQLGNGLWETEYNVNRDPASDWQRTADRHGVL